MRRRITRAPGGLAPVGRVGKPEDVASAVTFLVSEEAAFVTGQTLFVDGGLFSIPRRLAISAGLIKYSQSVKASEWRCKVM
ncbi:MAG: SDR family oxidoreductase [Terriglobia bacterium]